MTFQQEKIGQQLLAKVNGKASILSEQVSALTAVLPCIYFLWFTAIISDQKAVEKSSITWQSLSSEMPLGKPLCDVFQREMLVVRAGGGSLKLTVSYHCSFIVFTKYL